MGWLDFLWPRLPYKDGACLSRWPVPCIRRVAVRRAFRALAISGVSPCFTRHGRVAGRECIRLLPLGPSPEESDALDGEPGVTRCRGRRQLRHGRPWPYGRGGKDSPERLG